MSFNLGDRVIFNGQQEGFIIAIDPNTNSGTVYRHMLGFHDKPTVSEVGRTVWDAKLMEKVIGKEWIIGNPELYSWGLWVRDDEFVLASSTPSISIVGCSCRRCKTYCEYASPNQADGTFVCYGCRSLPFYGSMAT